MNPEKAKLRIAGILFLAAFLAYGIGVSVVTGIIEAPNPVAELAVNRSQFITGAALMLVNPVIVTSIGLMLLPMLRRFNRPIAWSYLATRATEAIALAAGAISLLLLVMADSSPTQTEVVRIGFSNALFPSPSHPEHGRTRHPTRLNLSLETGGDLLGLSQAPSTGYPWSPGRMHRSRKPSDAADSSGPGRRVA